MDLNDLYTFALVARHGTISGAAASLKVPKSTVSRRVRRLEDTLGVELLRRTPRSVSLTPDGIALHKRAAPALHDLKQSSDALAKHQVEPSGHLRITTVPDFGQTPSFVAMIESYGLTYPKVSVETQFSYRRVNLVEEGFDVAFRLHPAPIQPDENLMSRHVATVRGGFYVSPKYGEKHGLPASLADLKDHHCAMSTAYPSQPYMERLLGGAPGAFSPKWTSNDFAVLAQIAMSGSCVVVLTTFIGERLVEEGKLIRIFPDCTLPEGAVSLIWPASRHLTPRVQTFVDHAVRLVDDLFE